MKILNKYINIKKREMLDCRMKSLQELLRNVNLNISSYEVFLLSQAFTFNYKVIKIPKINISNIFYSTASIAYPELNLFESLGLEYFEDTIDINNITSEIQSFLKEDIPMLFRLDGRLLQNETLSSKFNWQHLSYVLVVGIDLKHSNLLVILSNNDSIATYNKISIDIFKKSISSTCIPIEPNAKYVYLKKTTNYYNKDILKSKIKESILSISKVMLNSNFSYNIPTNRAEDIYGIQGMIEFEKKIIYLMSNNNLEYEQIKFQLLFIRNNFLYGSFSSYRLELFNSLKYVADKYNIPNIYQLLEELQSSAKLWKNLFILLNNMINNIHKLNIYLHDFTCLWENIINIEIHFFKQLIYILEEKY